MKICTNLSKWYSGCNRPKVNNPKAHTSMEYMIQSISSLSVQYMLSNKSVPFSTCIILQFGEKNRMTIWINFLFSAFSKILLCTNLSLVYVFLYAAFPNLHKFEGKFRAEKYMGNSEDMQNSEEACNWKEMFYHHFCPGNTRDAFHKDCGATGILQQTDKSSMQMLLLPSQAINITYTSKDISWLIKAK